MPMPIEKRKQSLYFPEEMLLEIMKEASRQDRSMSWIVQQAWRAGRAQVQAFPSVGPTNPDQETLPPQETAGGDQI